MSNIYLCHKCLGHLNDEAGPSAYACFCRSGYIRDWQSPTPAADVLTLQAEECAARATLYIGQEREASDPAVIENNARIARIAAKR